MKFFLVFLSFAALACFMVSPVAAEEVESAGLSARLRRTDRRINKLSTKQARLVNKALKLEARHARYEATAKAQEFKAGVYAKLGRAELSLTWKSKSNRYAKKSRKTGRKISKIRSKIARITLKLAKLRALLARLQKKLLERNSRNKSRDARRKNRNCRDPRKYRSASGKWKKRKPTQTSRRWVRSRNGIWYNGPSKKYEWKDCKWVLSAKWANRIGAIESNRAGSKDLRSGNTAAQLKAAHEEIARLRKQVTDAKAPDLASQEKLLSTLIHNKAKAEFDKFINQFLEHYLNAGPGGMASVSTARVMRDMENPSANTNFSNEGPRIRYDPQPGTSEFPYNGSEEPGDDVRPPRSRSIRSARLTNVP